jgi:hypothetical protein
MMQWIMQVPFGEEYAWEGEGVEVRKEDECGQRGCMKTKQ